LVSESDGRLQLFLRDLVSSYEELEALLFLARNADRALSGSEVAMSLSATAESIDEALKSLAAGGRLLEVTQRSGVLLHRYAPKNEADRLHVSELQQAYDERRLSVMQMMSTNALERVRSAAMQRLADAFRIESGKK